MFVYFIVFALLLGFFATGVVLNYRISYRPNRKLEIILSIFTVLCYVFVIMESISNSNMQNHFVTMMLPHNNIVCFMYIICPLFLLIPDKFRIKKYLMLSVLIMSGVILCDITSVTIEFFNIYKSFAVKYMWYVIGLLLLIYLALSNILRNNVQFKTKHYLICLGSILVFYGLITMLNLLLDLKLFGIGYKFFDLVTYQNKFGLLLDFGSVIGSSILVFSLSKIIKLIKNK